MMVCKLHKIAFAPFYGCMICGQKKYDNTISSIRRKMKEKIHK